MMSIAVMPSPYDKCRVTVNSPTNYVVAALGFCRQPNLVIDTDALLSQLKARGIRNVDIARVLGLPDSRVPEIRDKRRALKLDEGAKLVQAFGLESATQP